MDKIKAKNDDDFVDRLNYFTTPFILGLFGLAIFLKQLFGTSVSCFEPPEFTVNSFHAMRADFCSLLG
jgi:hypothetical protein